MSFGTSPFGTLPLGAGADDAGGGSTLQTSPIDFQWQTTTGELLSTDFVTTTPIDFQWEIVTGTIEEQTGDKDVLDATPVVFQWYTNTASFYETVEGIAGSWSWNDQTGSFQTKLESSTINFQWEITAGELLGTTSVNGNPIEFQWETTVGSLAYIVPTQESGTIGGKKDKKRKLPYYDSKEYKSTIDLDDVVNNKREVVSVETKLVNSEEVHKQTEDKKKYTVETIAEENPILADILARKNIVAIPSTIEVIVDEDVYDEEAAVIMLLLAA